MNERAAQDWAQWCDEREVRLLAIRSALRRGDLTVAQVKQRYGLINCGCCGERHR